MNKTQQWIFIGFEFALAGVLRFDY